MDNEVTRLEENPAAAKTPENAEQFPENAEQVLEVPENAEQEEVPVVEYVTVTPAPAVPAPIAVQSEPKISLFSAERLPLLIAAAALVVAVVALVFAVAKTDLTIGQGELFVESGSVNRMLGNLIAGDLARRVPSGVRVRDIAVTVELGGSEDGYESVSDLSGGDSVSIEVIFFPQKGVEEFARDCRAVLDVMEGQDVAYNEIVFRANDNFTNINARLSGLFTANVTVEDIMAVTYYVGIVEVPDDDIPDVTAPD